MIFSTGDLLVLGILTILLFVFRQFDRNNRSLEKVRSYADKVKAQLDEIVQEKKEAIRDLSIDMDIQEKTDKEILRRVEEARGEMVSHAESIDNFNEKVTIYNERVEELVAMTARVDENLMKIRNESEYVDSVGKRISESLRKIQLLEKAIGALQEEFVKQNKINLDKFQEEILRTTEERIQAVEEKISQSDRMVGQFSETVEDMDRRYNDMAEEKLALFSNEMLSVRKTYDGYLAEIAEKGLKLESEVFDELNNSINTRSERIEDNWKNGINDLKDSISGTVEEINSRLRTVEESVSLVEKDSEAAVIRLSESQEEKSGELQDLAERNYQTVLSSIEDYRRSLAAELEEIRSSMAESYSGDKAVLENHGKDIESRIEAVTLTVEQFRSELDNRMNEVASSSEEQLAGHERTNSEKLEDLSRSIDRFRDELNERIKSSVSLVDDRMADQARIYEEKIGELNGSLSLFSEEVDSKTREAVENTDRLVADHRQDTTNKLEALSVRFDDTELAVKRESEEVLGRCRRMIGEQEQESTTLLDRMKVNMEEVTLFTEKIDDQMNRFREQVDNETRELGEKLEGITGSLEKSIEDKAAELEGGLMKSVEDKVGEYEQAVSRRFDRLDGFMEDLDNLEGNLKVSLQEAVASVERDFQLFNENLTEERATFRNSLAEDTNELRLSMDELEKGLEALKSRAYDNVSEKLKVFEDDFFSDLRKRDTAMQNSLEEWQKSIDFRMEEIDQKGRREREEMQQFSTSDMKVKLSELQSHMYGQFDQFKGQVQNFRESIEISIADTENEMKDFSQSVGQEIDGLRENSSVYFEEQFTEFKSGIAERFEKADKTIDMKFEEMLSGLDVSRQELDTALDRSRADMAAWKQKLEQQMKMDESALTDQIQEFKTDVGENITLIREDFRSQREDLIVSTNEERTNLRREIGENSSRIEELNKELERSSLQALDKFRSDYDDFILDFQRKSHDIQSEAELHAREVRQGLADTREKVDALQKKMYGQIEEDYNLLSGSLKEIDAKQQDFIAQTRIFERADSMKDALTADIEALKEQVALVEKSSSEAFLIRDQYADILKLNEEVQNKLSNVMSEKQKIDTMDERINRIISLSDSVNLKLDELSSTHDSLQEYQVRLRQIEDLQDSIDKRYARLEKKGAVLDTTTEGVDKNFQLMNTIEKAVNTVRNDLAPLFESLKEAKQQHAALQGEQEKIRVVVDKLSGLDESISELDSRIDAMNKAREWVAGAEARMDSIGKKAREQVQLFGKLMEKEGQAQPARGRRAPAGSPDMEIREMVLRLAHEGWKSEEIARTTKLSQGEVELILELSPDFTRK